MSARIDLSQVAPPDVVEAVALDVLSDEWWGRAVGENPGLAGIPESDPARKWTRTGAYREGLVRQRINEASRACMLATATGADLENLAALFGLRRETLVEADPDARPPVEAVMETDERLRRRAQLFPGSISTAGPASAYRFHALGADPLVKDVHVASPTPGSVTVTVLAEIVDPKQDTGVAGADMLAAVRSALNAETVRPMGDVLTVQTAGIVDYSVVAELTIGDGPDASEVLSAAKAAVSRAAAELHALGRGAPRSVLIAALQAPGALKVNLTSPAADVAATAVQAARASSIKVTKAS